MLLEQYIFEVLKMNDASSISNLANYLNDNREELIKSISYSNDYDHSYLDNFIKSCDNRIEFISSGAFRIVYSIPGEEWVLKIACEFDEVIDLESSGIESNIGEIEISEGKHGLAARDVFVRVYDYDRVDKYPYWMICQKVVPLNKINDLEVLKKVFPTFWNMMHEKEGSRETAVDFRSMIENTLMNFAYYGGGSNKSSKENFYDAADSSQVDCIDFEDVVFYEDFRKISSAFAYIRSEDMHEGNFGLTSLKNPSPESIVILDFSTDYHI
tara:strand:+ start:453 stop:1262 length:810 start_codon:yes stop_codon:yes gene_type:complete